MNFVLNYEGFEDNIIISERPVNMGVQYVFRFENGYGASVVKGPWTYGGPQDLWELAVLRFFGNSDAYDLEYGTEITDDVLGWRDDEEIRELLLRIKGLSSPSEHET
jgi:hypothetical protein